MGSESPHAEDNRYYIKYLLVLLFLLPLHVTAITLTDDEYQYYEKQRVEALFQEQQESLSRTLTDRANAQRGKWYGQCVIGVRQFLGVGRDQVQGFAKNTEINSQEWLPGQIIVFKGMSKSGHVGATISYLPDADGWDYYYDTNGDWRGRGEIRKIKRDDPQISGYRTIE